MKKPSLVLTVSLLAVASPLFAGPSPYYFEMVRRVRTTVPVAAMTAAKPVDAPKAAPASATPAAPEKSTESHVAHKVGG